MLKGSFYNAGNAPYSSLMQERLHILDAERLNAGKAPYPFL